MVCASLTSFTQPKMLPLVIPVFSKFGFLVRDKWRSEVAIKLVPGSTPILLLSAAKDEVVPPSHMQELYEIACAAEAEDEKQERRRTRKLVLFPEGTHSTPSTYYTLSVNDDTPSTDTMWGQPQYWKNIRNFVDSVLDKRASITR